jgi:hypothetical protein
VFFYVILNIRKAHFLFYDFKSLSNNNVHNDSYLSNCLGSCFIYHKPGSNELDRFFIVLCFTVFSLNRNSGHNRFCYTFYRPEAGIDLSFSQRSLPPVISLRRFNCRQFIIGFTKSFYLAELVFFGASAVDFGVCFDKL